MNSTKPIILMGLIGIFFGISCSKKSGNSRIYAMKKPELEAAIKDSAGVIALTKSRIGNIDTTSPSDFELYQRNSRLLQKYISEARKVGLTDSEINILVRDGQMEAFRALSEIEQKYDR